MNVAAAMCCVGFCGLHLVTRRRRR
jgi:hypothetical protein